MAADVHLRLRLDLGKVAAPDHRSPGLLDLHPRERLHRHGHLHLADRDEGVGAALFTRDGPRTLARATFASSRSSLSSSFPCFPASSSTFCRASRPASSAFS